MSSKKTRFEKGELNHILTEARRMQARRGHDYRVERSRSCGGKGMKNSYLASSFSAALGYLDLH